MRSATMDSTKPLSAEPTAWIGTSTSVTRSPSRIATAANTANPLIKAAKNTVTGC